jgi:hypothetical protein
MRAHVQRRRRGRGGRQPARRIEQEGRKAGRQEGEGRKVQAGAGWHTMRTMRTMRGRRGGGVAGSEERAACAKASCRFGVGAVGVV